MITDTFALWWVLNAAIYTVSMPQWIVKSWRKIKAREILQNSNKKLQLVQKNLLIKWITIWSVNTFKQLFRREKTAVNNQTHLIIQNKKIINQNYSSMTWHVIFTNRSKRLLLIEYRLNSTGLIVWFMPVTRFLQRSNVHLPLKLHQGALGKKGERKQQVCGVNLWCCWVGSSRADWLAQSWMRRLECWRD